jgi:hypothetical protein
MEMREASRAWDRGGPPRCQAGLERGDRGVIINTARRGTGHASRFEQNIEEKDNILFK